MIRATVSTGSGEWTRVIVLTPRGESARAAHDKPTASATAAQASQSTSALPESLRAAFAARDWFAVVHDDPYLALADLAVRDLTQAARAAWGLQRLERLALVIVQPTDWPAPMLDDLVDAAARYLPSASIWHARDGQVTAAVTSPRDITGDITKVRCTQAPTPRAAPAPAAVRDNTQAKATPPSDERSGRISRAEIDMLLRVDDSGRAPGDHPGDVR